MNSELQYYQTDLNPVGGIFANVGNVFVTILTIIFVICLAVLIGYISLVSKRLWNYYQANKEGSKKMKFIEITLPKNTSEEQEKEMGRKDENAVVAQSENIFQIISHYSNSFDWQDWLNGTPPFSFELVKYKNKISFYIGCPLEAVEVVEKQIVSSFVRCRIAIHDEMDFMRDRPGYVQEMKLKKDCDFPFRTYNQMNGDPLNTVINAMEVAKDDEIVCIQMVLAPVNNYWQKSGRVKAHKLQNEKDKNNVASQTGAGEKEKQKSAEELAQSSGYLTPNQQNIVKRLEEKAARPGFRFALRVAAFAADTDRAKNLVDNICPAFRIFDLDPFNGIGKRKLFYGAGLKDLPRAIFYNQTQDFLERRPALSDKAIVNVEEANSIWHLPNYMIQSPSIDWMLSYKPVIPQSLPQDPNYGILIGYADGGYYNKPVYSSVEDRTRHSYILGGSGSGKSEFMTQMVLADISSGSGVCVIDPHGQTVDNILLRMPKHRLDDVIVISPTFVDAPVGLNVLSTDPNKPEQKTVVINNLFTIWNKLYDMQSAGGPMFEMYMKNAARLVMSHVESGNTLMEINKVFSDKSFRDFKMAMCTEPDVSDFWQNQATKAKGEHSLENMTTYITSKLAPFVTNDFIRPMIGQCANSVDMRQAMDNNKIVLVKLEKGIVGEMSTYLLGMVIISNILMAGMGRQDNKIYGTDGQIVDRMGKPMEPFFVYIDEMQNFLFDSIPQALEEIRKYKVGFTLAHQFVKQVVSKGDERIKDSVFANTGSKFIFNCGVDDAEYIEKEFRPVLSAKDLMNPERFTCSARIMLNGQKTQPFNLRAVGPLSKEIDEETYKYLVDQSKLLYGTPIMEVNKDIKERSEIKF